MSKSTNSPFDPNWARITRFYKTDAIACLRTSLQTFDALGIEPDEIQENPYRKKGKVFLYTRQQIQDAARRLERWSIFVGLGGDPCLIPESARRLFNNECQTKSGARS